MPRYKNNPLILIALCALFMGCQGGAEAGGKAAGKGGKGRSLRGLTRSCT